MKGSRSTLLASSALVLVGIAIGCAAKSALPVRAAEPAATADAVEYRTYRTTAFQSQDADVEDLNKLGARGWHLVATVVRDGTTSGYLLMRSRAR
jgi:hypothetical protein